MLSNKREPSRRQGVSLVRPGHILNLLCGLIITAVILAVVWPSITSASFPEGADQMGHLFRLWYLTKVVLEEHAIPGWLPQWYNGQEFSQYYPPLVYWVMLPINLVLRDPPATYRVFIFAAMLSAAITTFFLFRGYLGRYGALVAGLLFALAPFNLRTIFWSGNLPRTLVLALLPATFYALLRFLEKQDRLSATLLTLLTAALILAHNMQAIMILIGLGVFSLAYLLLEDAPLSKVAMLASLMLLGIGIALWWLIPAITHFDLPNVPGLQPEKVVIYSAPLEVLNPLYARDKPMFVYAGLSLLLAAALGAALLRSRLAISLSLSAFLAVVLAFGVHLPFYRYLPLSYSLLPWRFLNFALFPLALLSAGLVSWLSKWRPPFYEKRAVGLVLSLILLPVFFLDFRPYFDLVRPRTHDYLLRAMQEMAKSENDGRFMFMSASAVSEITYFPTVYGRKSQALGWGVEETIHRETTQELSFALAHGFPEYLTRTLGLWNVRHMLVDNDNQAALEAINSAGFLRQRDYGYFSMMESPRPSSYVLYQDRSAIAVGYAAPWISMAYPWISKGTSVYLEDYPTRFLSQFDMLIFSNFRFKSRRGAEELFERLAGQGKLVLIDLTGVGGAGILDVLPKQVTVKGTYTAKATSELSQSGLPAPSFGEAPWSGFSYIGLDKNIATIEVGGKEETLLGYREIGASKIYFLGFNLFANIVQNRDVGSKAILEAFFDLRKPNRASYPKPLEKAILTRSSDRIELTYELDAERPILLSESYSPHWRATVGSKSIPLFNYENLLMLYPPGGTGKVVLHYGATPIQRVSAVAAAISMLLLLLLLTRGWGCLAFMGRYRLSDLPPLIESATRGAMRHLSGGP